MFEQAFKNIDDVLWKEAGCASELDYTEQTSWLLFLKFLDGLEQDKAMEAELLPEFFKDEAELRALWSLPDTRKKMLEGLAEKGFGTDQLHEMQNIIDAEKSDLFDVLAYVSFALEPLTREERAAKAMALISTHFNDKQKVFLDFVLSHYISIGVEELDRGKLSPLLQLKYGDSISDAVADLGNPTQISGVFVGFQKYLYQQEATA